MKLNKIAISLALLSSLALSTQASAHGMWIAKAHGEMAVNYGHASSTDAYEAKKIKSAQGFKTDGSKIDVEMKDHGNHVELKADDAAILSAVMDNGFYAKDKDGKTMKDENGYINKRGDKVEGAASSINYFKESVSYLNPRVKPLAIGLTLEIVPSVNPSSLTEGEDLKVQVLFEGKPVADMEVNTNYFDKKSPVVKTDKEGYAVIKVATSSFNILAAGHEVKSDDPFDGKKFSSTLSFKAKRVKK